MKKVLVLCSANSVRSQMAEAYLKFYAKGYGIFFSAGLENHGINPYAAKVMEEDNIDLNEHLSKTVEAFNNIRFDYLITVCQAAKEQIPNNFTYQEHLHFDIDDPAGTDGSEEEILQAFLDTRETVKRHILQFIGRNLLPKSETPST